MPLTTYAQNREDLYLYALVGHLSNGFYVDIGAYHSTEHSVTKLFYDLGWHGINVEANPELFGPLNADRARDRNLNVAVGSSVGTVQFRIYTGLEGLSTADPGMKQLHEASGFDFRDLEVPCRRLDEIFMNESVEEVAFLKVDVEGAEIDVLRSNDWNRWRPRVVMCEASNRDSLTAELEGWGYREEFFDGLNLYFVDKNDSQLSILQFAPSVLVAGYQTALEAAFRSFASTSVLTEDAAPYVLSAIGVRGAASLFAGAARSAVTRRVGRATRRSAETKVDTTKPGDALGVASRPPSPISKRTRSDRVLAALASRATAVNDFFGGWDESDLAVLERWRVPLSGMQPKNGEILDWLGCRTAIRNHSWLNVPKSNRIVVDDLPVPDDCIHAEAIEYIGMLTAVERSVDRQTGRFVAVELGSSYGPWSVASCVTALRAGFQFVHGVAVEASEPTLLLAHEHVSRNDLVGDPRVKFSVVHGAVSPTDGTARFPRVDTRIDNGARVERGGSGRDYRGLALSYSEVPALSLATLLGDYAVVDFLHLDLQGAELELLLDSEFQSVLDEKVKVMLLATQSRYIEGVALNTMPSRGWTLFRERPTMFTPNDRTSDVDGWTTRDGAQIWLRQ